MFCFFALLSWTISCNQNNDKKVQTNVIEKKTEIRFYSKSISDSLSIFVNLPNDYNPQQKEKYPVVYLLDANLYFDIVATIINKYSEVGLAPSVILVGIGYKDFPTMDSLRNRDYTYPVAIPEYQMAISGGADKFLNCINSELIPFIDKGYDTDTSKRVLAGHSLGGYFSAYALLQDLSGKNNNFSGYIAASPSIHYNKYYLLNQFKETPQKIGQNKKIKAYFTFGGLEEEENATDSSMIKQSSVSEQLSKQLAVKQSNYLIYKSDIFSNLGHMETQIPTFIKGLQWTLREEK
ncbi:MAG: alpha/beta hydrolase [Chitinophagaceae bacterium]|nr:alpha/beta hydrolase [Chitinophagaceae bacterium]